MSEETVVEVSSDLGTQTPESTSNEAVQKPEDSAASEVQQDESADAAAEARKHKGGFQKRIDELTRQREEERREKERLLSLVERLTDKAPESKQASQRDAEPKREDFDDYEAFLEARAEYRADRRATERVEAKLKEYEERESKRHAETAAAEAARAWETKLSDTRGRIADFDDVVNSADVSVSPLVREVVLTSDNGPEILYALGKNRAEAMRIMKLPVAQQGVALGMFMAKNGPVATQTTKVPDPVRSPRTGSGSVDPLSEKLDIDTWRKNFEKKFYGDRR